MKKEQNHTKGQWVTKKGKLKTPTWNKPNLKIPTGIDEQDITIIKIKDEEGSGIAYVFNWDGNQEANSQLIVKSVNMHHNFIELAKTIFEAYTDKGEKNLSALEISFFIAAKKLLKQAEQK